MQMSQQTGKYNSVNCQAVLSYIAFCQPMQCIQRQISSNFPSTHSVQLPYFARPPALIDSTISLARSLPYSSLQLLLQPTFPHSLLTVSHMIFERPISLSTGRLSIDRAAAPEPIWAKFPWPAGFRPNRKQELTEKILPPFRTVRLDVHLGPLI